MMTENFPVTVTNELITGSPKPEDVDLPFSVWTKPVASFIPMSSACQC